MTRSRSLLALALALAALSGCGGDDTTTTATEAGTSEGVGKLTNYLPADAQLISAVDLAAAREELGLDPDADVTDAGPVVDGDVTLDDPEGELITAAGIGIPPISSFLTMLKEDPTIAALDGTEITAAASNQIDPKGQVEVIQTEQPFEQIAEALVKQGYEREGDALSKQGAGISEVADAGDGVVVLSGGDGYSAAELAQSPPGGPEDLVALLEPPGEPIGIANTPVDTSGCVTAYGGREKADASGGTIRLLIDGQPNLDNLDAAALQEVGITTAGDAKAEGDVIEIPFEAEPQPGGNPIGQAVANIKPSEIYDCG